MKEKIIINAKIIDPKNNLNEIGGLIIDVKGKIKAIGKKVKNSNIPKNAEVFDAKKKFF